MSERLDALLVKAGYAASRERAKELILSGNVFVNGKQMDKASVRLDGASSVIEVTGGRLRYVSRGGLKLEKAMQEFPISLRGAVCMDVGASTGGFTDCMLQNGASKVYAVDVGHDQLAPVLRENPAVICMEGTNIRLVEPEDIGEPVDFVSIDVSFISLTKVLGPVKALMAERASLVCLIKPQFEAGRENVGKRGVVKDRRVHMEVAQAVIAFARKLGFAVLGFDFSPVKGPEGNIEYLLFLQNTPTKEERLRPEPDVAGLVRQSHELL